MNFFVETFNILLYQPLLKALLFLYEYLPGHDFGVAVIVLTLLIKFVLYPLGTKGIKSQRALQELQPKMKEIQEKFKNDKEKQARATMELYKKEKINPFSGFLLLLIQLPILFALFRVFWKGFEGMGQIDTTFLGMIDLAKSSAILAVVTGIAQFIQAKTMTPPTKKLVGGQAPQKTMPDFSGMMQKQMLYFFPIFTVFILWRLPSAIALYWLVTTLFTIGQQYITLKKKKNDSDQSRKT